MAAIVLSIFRFTTLQEEHGFLVTFLAQIVQEIGIGIPGEFSSHPVQFQKDRGQVRFRAASPKTFHSRFQLHEFIQNGFFEHGHYTHRATF